MSRSRTLAFSALILLGSLAAVSAQAPQGAAAPAAPDRPRAAGPARRPPLFLKEEWKQNEKNDEHPITQESIGNPNVELKLYGPNAQEIDITGRAGDENNPIHVWTGMCNAGCAVLLRDTTSYADLTGLARVRWNTKTSGFHKIRPMVRLADGNYYVADREDGSTRDWIVSEISFADLHWMKLDPARVVTTGTLQDKIDLSKVDEIGFVDLTPGSGHGAGGWVDVAQIEIYANKVARAQ